MTTHPMPLQSWIYRARPVRVIDGDTIDAVLDQGLHTSRHERFRLLGINTPELHGDDRELGLMAKGYVELWLGSGTGEDWPLVVSTYKADSFGRFLARVWRTLDGACLNDELIAHGYAIPFMEGAHRG